MSCGSLVSAFAYCGGEAFLAGLGTVMDGQLQEWQGGTFSGDEHLWE